MSTMPLYEGDEAMAQSKIEERVTALEKELADLRAVIANGAGKTDWQSTVGMFRDDEGMKRIQEEGRKWREAERRKAGQKPAKKRRAKA
jgi:hypothetical protein